MSDCIFCKILHKQIPSKIVYEDELVVAFEDVNPQAPVHTLVIPKKHIPTISQCSDEDYMLISHIFKVINNIAKQKGLTDRGYRIVNNCNAEAGQTVFHIHFHLLGG
ncbi:MAG: histidine triad nucleotide-binding protein, partial [Thermodesulfovibrionales bacterium]|nr:histidine triad nucleotide-binding protein [Thermodesulfovibrionales bacterium]